MDMPNLTEISISITVAVATGAAMIYIVKQLFGKKKAKIVLVNPEVKYPLRLVDKEIVSHDTRRFTFALTSPEHLLGLPVGQHVYLSATINGELVSRPYTPISHDDELGYVTLVIKVYNKGVNPKFPDGGKMSQYLDQLPINHHIDFRGPSGKLVYDSNGKFLIKPKPNSVTPDIKRVNKVGMIAGGTGLTPMFQLAQKVLQNCKDLTELFLLYANQSEDDILLKDELENMSCEQFRVWYTVDRAGENWNYDVGFVNEEMIKKHMPGPSNETLIVLCGPPPMVKYACLPNLEKLGYNSDMIFSY